MIQKRIGAITFFEQQAYLCTMAELSSQSVRKRPRDASYIPPFGDATWDEKASMMPDGKADLAAARGNGLVPNTAKLKC
jgi:hypothetical protein